MVHFLRDMLGHCGKAAQPLVSRAIAEVTVVLGQSAPKVARLLAEAEDGLLAFMAFPAEHWNKLRSTNPLERVNREIGRRSDAGIYPNDAALFRLAGALLIEQNDEWLVGRRYLSEDPHAGGAGEGCGRCGSRGGERAAGSLIGRPLRRGSYPTTWDLTYVDESAYWLGSVTESS